MVGELPARVIDLGPEGAGIEHSAKLQLNDVFQLQIDWRQTIRCKVRVRHSKLRKLEDEHGPSVFQTGLSFIGLSEASAVVIDSILIDEVKRQVTEWEANLTGTRRDRLSSIGFAESSSRLPVAYVWHRLVNGKWITATTKDPNQPIDGFAVCDDQSRQHVELLRDAYQSYDDDDRNMLRMMAHLAIANRNRAD